MDIDDALNRMRYSLEIADYPNYLFPALISTIAACVAARKLISSARYVLVIFAFEDCTNSVMMNARTR